MTHPITPPLELVQQWEKDWHHSKVKHTKLEFYIAFEAAQWGADQELKACCDWFQDFYKLETWMERDLKALRTARRPKPPSLKEQALDELTAAERLYPTDWSTIRHALEALPND